jgi:hypothetical protein
VFTYNLFLWECEAHCLESSAQSPGSHRLGDVSAGSPTRSGKLMCGSLGLYDRRSMVGLV